jgi:hypothetical protein
MIVQGLLQKEWEGKKFIEVNLEGKTCSCWQPSVISVLKMGDTVEGGITEKNGRYQVKITKINGNAVESKSDYKGKAGDPRSFAASYAKDIAVICIDKGILVTSKEIDGTLEHYYKWFLEKMEG